MVREGFLFYFVMASDKKKDTQWGVLFDYFFLCREFQKRKVMGHTQPAKAVSRK